jgi:hypothetical protein
METLRELPTCTAGTHEGCQCTRLDVTLDVVQQAEWAISGWYMVVQVFPGKCFSMLQGFLLHT